MRRPHMKFYYIRTSPEVKFLSRINATDGCWEWLGSKYPDGYGYLAINRKNVRAHRFSYEYYFGSIPSGLFVCHSCDNPSCVNPSHLFLGTNQDNVNDMVAKGRHKHFDTPSRFTDTDFAIMLEARMAGFKFKPIAKYFGIHPNYLKKRIYRMIKQKSNEN